jgi:hypothetical protein
MRLKLGSKVIKFLNKTLKLNNSSNYMFTSKFISKNGFEN